MDALGFGCVVAGPVRSAELHEALAELHRRHRREAALVLDLADPTPADMARVRQSGTADAVLVPAHLGASLQEAAGALPLLVEHPADTPFAVPEGVAGVVVPATPGPDPAAIRATTPPGTLILVSGGVDSPGTAVALLSSGADAVVATPRDLMWAGPGLAQRTAEALEGSRPPVTSRPSLLPWRWPPWVWGAITGVGLVAGGVIGMLIALGPALLPYDEAFVGLDLATIDALNPRLRNFLRHDRITFAGTLISIGVIYVALSLAGLRHRERWARRILLLSGAVGFASLFLFLGFGYFDPAHAAGTALLFPCFLLALRRPQREYAYPAEVDTGPDSAPRRRALLGQLLLVGLATGLLIGGAVIATIGVGEVFVPSDLRFLRADSATLTSASDRMLALVAHDRAGFGGALVSDAVAILLLALWAYRPGARWLWWTLLVSGGIGTGAAIGVHVAVGYTDLLHLAPVVLAAGALVAVLALSRPYLLGRDVIGSHPGRTRS